MKANRYMCGPATIANRDAWVECGEQLFGDYGYLRRFLRRGVIKHGELNISGCVVLGFLGINGDSTRAEIYRGLESFVQIPTLRSAIAKLIRLGFITESDGRYSLNPAILDLLDEYERERDLDKFVRFKEALHATQRAEYAKYVRELNYLKEFKTALRSLPCSYCGMAPKRGEGTVEHFPPLHWGGSDRFSLLVPACHRCNNKDSTRIKKTPPLVTPFPGKVDLVIEGDPVTFLRDLMYFEHDMYASAMATGDAEAARERVAEQFPLWVAYRDKLALHVDETLADNALVGFIRLTSDNPEYLDHCKNVRHTVDAFKPATPP
jgi:hypothetical protein